MKNMPDIRELRKRLLSMTVTEYIEYTERIRNDIRCETLSRKISNALQI